LTQYAEGAEISFLLLLVLYVGDVFYLALGFYLCLCRKSIIFLLGQTFP